MLYIQALRFSIVGRSGWQAVFAVRICL